MPTTIRHTNQISGRELYAALFYADINVWFTVQIVSRRGPRTFNGRSKLIAETLLILACRLIKRQKAVLAKMS
jgi:hypothetical protein